MSSAIAGPQYLYILTIYRFYSIIKVIRKEFALRKKKEIRQHISKVIDAYNQQAELYKRLAEEVKRTSDAIKILDNRLNELIDEYNAAEDEDNE